MSRFESGKRTNSTSSASTRRGNSPVPSAVSPAPGSTYSADHYRRPASYYGQSPAHALTSNSWSDATTSSYSSKQPSQAAGRTQHVDAMSKFYANSSRESLSAPTSAPSSTRSNGSGDSNRPSAGYSLPNPERGVPPAAETSNSSTYVTERGRTTDTPNKGDAVASRESSRAPPGGPETEHTDDEASDQVQATDDEPDDPSSLATRGSSNPATTEVVEQITQPIGPSQHTEATGPAISPASRETSPSLSLDSSAAVSLNSEDFSRSSANDSHATGAHGLADHGVSLTETTIQQPTEVPEHDQLLKVPRKPNPSTSTETPHARVDALEDAVVNTNQGSATGVLLEEPLSLTDLGSDGPSATEAVKYLVQAVGRDVVTFRRNTQVSFMVVERAREIVKAINEYIVKVENSTTGDWDSFEKFTVAIEPLEGILFTLLAFTEDEKARYFANTSSIEECVSSAENWASNREGLSKALDGFDSREELVGLFDEPNTDSRKREHREAQIYDDLTLLGEMRTTVQTFISEDPDKFPPHVRQVETSLDKLQNKLINESHPDWLTVITIKTSMLVEGIIEIVKVASLDADILNHLKSKAVWKAALELVKLLEGIDESQPDLPQSAQRKYNAFVETLKKPGKFPLPGSYVDLMKQAGHIRRPFQAQGFALVMLCRYLADRFNDIGDSAVTIDDFNTLEEAFEQTLDALQAATRAVIELKTFDLTNFRSHETVEAFGKAEALIRESFQSFNLDAEWTQKQSELTAAFKKDKERMAKLNNMLSRSPSDATEKVKVNVTIHESSPDGTELGAALVEEVNTMRLLALRWSIAGMLKPEETKRRARTAGSFFKQKDGKWLEILASHSTLEEIVGSESEVDLKLIVP